MALTEYYPVVFKGDSSDAVRAARELRAAIAGVEEGAVGASATLTKAAESQISVTAKQATAQRSLIVTYRELAAAAEQGSAQQLAALKLVDSATRKLGAAAATGAKAQVDAELQKIASLRETEVELGRLVVQYGRASEAGIVSAQKQIAVQRELQAALGQTALREAATARGAGAAGALSPLRAAGRGALTGRSATILGYGPGQIAGFGAAIGLVASTKAAIDFEREMRNVNSIAKVSEGHIKAISARLLEMAHESGQAPKVLAAGLYDIVSSGFKADDAVKVLAASAKSATAGMTDTATAARAIDAALNAYHLSADQARKVSDVLFQTVNKGVITFEELSQNMGDLVPAAAPLGITLQEASAAIATLTLQGVPAAEAATRVKNSFIQLAKPSKDFSTLLRDNGYASGEAAVKQLGYVGVLQLIDKATHGNVTATAALAPEIRGLLGVVGLTGRNLKTYTDNLDAMKHASDGAGQTAAVFAEQSKSVGVQIDKAKAALAALAITIGAAILPALNPLIKQFGDWAQSMVDSGEAADKAKGFVEGLKGVVKDIYGPTKAAVDVLRVLVDALGGLKNTLELLFALKVASKLAGIAGGLTGIGTEAGIANTRSKGLLGTLGKLKTLGAITLVVELILHKGEVDKFLREHKLGFLTDSGAGLVKKELDRWNLGGGGGKDTTAKRSAIPAIRSGAIQLPTSQAGTHATAGFSGAVTAVDIFAQPATQVLAPEDGKLTRVSGSDPAEAPSQGQGGPWGRSFYYIGTSGTVYYGTHLSDVAPVGNYKKGDIIALVGDYPGNAPGADHIHFDVKAPKKYAVQGSSQPATLARPGAAVRPDDRRGQRTTGGPAGTLSAEQIRAVAYKAGFRGDALDTAVQVALAESSGQPGATNVNRGGSIDRGLWQINSVHGRQSTYDVEANARAAFAISKGGKDFSPWVAYTTGASAGKPTGTGTGVGTPDKPQKGDLLTRALQEQIAAAKTTVGNKQDDLKALRDEEAYLVERLQHAKKGSKLRIDLLNELGSVRESIKGATTGPKKTPDLIPDFLTVQLARARATLTDSSDDLKVDQQIEKYLLTKLKNVKKGGDLEKQYLDALAGVRGDIAGLEKVAQDAEDAAAAKRKEREDAAETKRKEREAKILARRSPQIGVNVGGFPVAAFQAANKRFRDYAIAQARDLAAGRLAGSTTAGDYTTGIADRVKQVRLDAGLDEPEVVTPSTLGKLKASAAKILATLKAGVGTERAAELKVILDKYRDQIGLGIDAIAAKVSGKRGVLEAAWNKLFDAADASISQRQDRETSLINRRYDAPTPTEALISARSLQKTESGLNETRAKATTPEEIAAADDAIYQHGLELQAEAERRQAEINRAEELRTSKIRFDAVKRDFRKELKEIADDKSLLTPEREQRISELLLKYQLDPSALDEIGSVLSEALTDTNTALDSLDSSMQELTAVLNAAAGRAGAATAPKSIPALSVEGTAVLGTATAQVRGPGGDTYNTATVTVPGVTINVNGAADPAATAEAVRAQFIDAIQLNGGDPGRYFGGAR